MTTASTAIRAATRPRTEKVTSLRHPLALSLLSLTFTTGVVDAVSYLGLGHVFAGALVGGLLTQVSLAAALGLAAGSVAITTLAYVAAAEGTS